MGCKRELALKLYHKINVNVKVKGLVFIHNGSVRNGRLAGKGTRDRGSPETFETMHVCVFLVL